jgi:hypothetical protein
MLEALCGSRSVQKILLFLFVNNRCYGTQLARLLNTPLTPIQKALTRLEEGGIIMSHSEGKTRLYQFNPTFPLLGELEQLLKRAFTLLPGHEKKDYYVVREEKPTGQLKRRRILDQLWKRLISVTQLTFNARSNSTDGRGWNGKGKGDVIALPQPDNSLIFQEGGTWKTRDGQEVSFSNVLRWTLDRPSNLISLEHLRYGAENPVFLFHLAPISNNTLASVDSHLCAQDAYFGQILLTPQSLRFTWRAIGPKKNEEMDYYYS